MTQVHFYIQTFSPNPLPLIKFSNHVVLWHLLKILFHFHNQRFKTEQAQDL